MAEKTIIDLNGMQVDITDLLKQLRPKSQLMSADDYISMVEYYQEQTRRELYLYTEVDQVSVQEVISPILKFNREDKGKKAEERKPIWLHIYSPGGSTTAGSALIDTILQSITPVYTVNDGMAYSMAGLIFIAGAKRFAYERSSVMLHDGSVELAGDMSKVMDFIGYQQKWEKQSKQFVLSHTSITDKEYDEQSHKDWYLLADYAKEKGMVDYIIGEDCTLDDILPAD